MTFLDDFQAHVDAIASLVPSDVAQVAAMSDDDALRFMDLSAALRKHGDRFSVIAAGVAASRMAGWRRGAGTGTRSRWCRRWPGPRAAKQRGRCGWGSRCSRPHRRRGRMSPTHRMCPSPCRGMRRWTARSSTAR
ncbi:hypothetical protein B5M43_014630 [Microbacterium sp. MEC084]|uniref:hypothetical protein n=1 Tax=Microbacterium sp. MEC084 TaxID=1963027 RepID=UPI00106FA8CA|nr:hypothetical protein [Microbacterium sp. MEC084]MCD1270042.1 hypothetical protein [Microbacterium sp. MEC084]